MWKLGFILLVACLCIDAKGHAKKKHKVHKSTKHADWLDDIESEDKRDAIAQPYDYSSYQTNYQNNAANTNTNQAAAYTSSSTSSYPAASSSNSYAASQRAAVASAPAPSASASAPAPAAPAPSPAPAAPAPAPAAPAPAPAPAAPAPAPAPAAPAPAPAPAAPAPAPAPAAAAPSPSPAPAPAPYHAPAPSTATSASSQSRSLFPSNYGKSSSTSSSYTYNFPSPAPAPAPASRAAPAPAYSYYAAAPAPSTATTTVAAAVAQAAKSATYSDLLKGKSKVKKDSCADDGRADHFCSKAHNPCYCEENHHFMYNYCKRSCQWCDSSVAVGHRFWRIVNSAMLPRSWIIKEIEFYSDKHAKKPIKVNPAKAYASTSYPGYLAANAFDGNKDSYWLPEGWYERYPGMDYIGMEFAQPVTIGAVRVIHQKNEKNATSTKMYLESSDFYENNYFKVFTMDNQKKKENKKFNYVDCPVYWRRFDNGEDVYCLKTTAEFLTWQQARDKCASYGADLVSINSPQENMFVNNELRLCGFTWVGLNDKKNESHFSWSDGNSMGFKSWAGDESYYEQDEYLNSKQNCVAASRTGEWRPFHCDNKFYSVCKMKLKAPEDDEEDMETKGHYTHKRVSKKSNNGKKVEDEDDDDDDETSGNSDIDASGEDSEDALNEIKKNVKKAVKASKKKTTEEDEDEDDEDDEDDSGSGSERSSSNVPANPSRKEEIEKVDDSFLDLKH